MTTEDLILKYSHNVIEHLGLKLYQNKPTNVLAELVSNAWDADASNVWIDFQAAGEGRTVTVVDDGVGMPYEVLRDSYLIIGKPKRDAESATAVSDNKKRYLMGRKGIGKLAPFGIAKTVEVITVSEDEESESLLLTWIELSLADIITNEPNTLGEHSYKPRVVASAVPFATALAGNFLSDEQASRLSSLDNKLRSVGSRTGTAVVMRDLSIKKIIDPNSVRESMGRRFTVTLMRDDFTVHVNGDPVTAEHALPEFEFRLPENTEAVRGTDKIKVQGIDREVSYWVGFVKNAAWPSDEAGVGVYAHGKIAQDRPFTFGVRGREIWTRYMYAVVEADWLDELPDDVVSTDRTSIDWDSDATRALYDWGTQKVTQWTTAYLNFRKREDRQKNKNLVNSNSEIKLTETEKDRIVDLISEISPRMSKREDELNRLIGVVGRAWIHEPMRKVVKSLWDQFARESDDASSFGTILEQLSKHLVPESLSVAVMFSQRAYALSVLYQNVHLGREVDLQNLIEKFPWILSPEMDEYTANQTLKTVVATAEKDGKIPTHFEFSGIPESKRPDFVFFSTSGDEHVTVVELKNPQVPLSLENVEQLRAYLTFLQAHSGHGKPDDWLRGRLIGRVEANLKAYDPRIEIMSWGQVFTASRKAHLVLLSAMLKGAHVSPDDKRISGIPEFGGKDTLDLLRKMAENDETLMDIMEAFSKTSSTNAATSNQTAT